MLHKKIINSSWGMGEQTELNEHMFNILFGKSKIGKAEEKFKRKFTSNFILLIGISLRKPVGSTTSIRLPCGWIPV
jgi:hypothetical protein